MVLSTQAIADIASALATKGFAAAAAASVSTSWTKFTLSTHAGSPGSQIPPQWIYLDGAQVLLTSIAGGCTKVTGRWSLDSAGDVPLGLDVERTLIAGIATPASSGIVLPFGFPLRRDDAGALYLWLKTDAGTVSAAPRAFFSVLRGS